METIIFSNRMGGRNLAYMALGFVIAGIWLMISGSSPLEAFAIVGGLLVCCYILVAIIIAFLGRSQIAELRVSDTGLRAEMAHMFGRGRVVDIAPASVSEWRVTGKSRKELTLEMVTPALNYRMPVAGAKTLDRDSLAKLAPASVVTALDALGAFGRR